MRKIVLYGFMIFAISLAVGFIYGNIWKSNNKKEANINSNTIENIVETISSEEKIAYNASFALKKYFKECGHFEFGYSELPSEIINLTKDELAKIYPDWKVEKFSNNEVVLSKEIEDMCDEHFILKLGEDNIEVYRDIKDGEEKLYKSTNISKEYLTSLDIQKLEEGIYVYGIGNLNSAIEDFE